MMREYFDRLAGRLCRDLPASDLLLLALEAEDGDFVRFNRARVRQAGAVRQQRLSLRLVRDGRQAGAGLDLSLDPDADRDACKLLLERLRGFCAALPVDPHLNLNRQPRDSESVHAGELPPGPELAADIAAAAAGLDLVGILASGRIWRGFANSLGQRNWHQRDSLNFDFSLYAGEDRAVKSSLAGSDWQPGGFAAHLDRLRPQLQALRRPRQVVAPGEYRVYLAPAALGELFDLLSWGGFGLKSLRTAQSPLLRLAEGERRLDRRIELSEDRARGMAPGFSDGGYLLPERVGLIRAGEHRDSLADERSAAEYGVEVNAAVEAPLALRMAPGDIAVEQVPARLETGLYVNNLWYCNYADRNQCRMTGMTRFASFWVEHGEIRAPAEVMRFDDSLYRMLGEGLIGLTRETELRVDAGTYGGRGLSSAELPGALIDAMRFPL